MSRNDSILTEARILASEHQHSRAYELLLSELGDSNRDPEVCAEAGLLACFLQREDEALQLLADSSGSEGAVRLGQILSNYAECRAKMAAKLGFEDGNGDSMRKNLRKLGAPAPESVDISLSACLIVKDEEKHLERCLASLKGNVDEIVVVDTGSKDATVAIAESFGARIGTFDWCEDFSAARNHSLSLATGHWALWIDADEVVDPTSWTSIREGLMRTQFGGYFVEIVNYMSDEHEGATYVHAPVRLFRRLPGVEFEGRIHEQIVPSLDKLGLPSANLQGARLHHYGYRPAEMAEKSKVERTIGLLEREVRESPEDAFHWFNLANAYSVARRKADAIRAARMSIRFLDPRNAFGSLAHQILSSALTSSGKPEEALDVCSQAERSGHFTKLTAFERAHALHRLRRFEEALDAIEVCMSMEWPSGMTGDYGIHTYKAATLKAQILIELERIEEALGLLDNALTVDPGFALAHFAKGEALRRCHRYEEALDAYRNAHADADFGAASLKASGHASMALGQVEDAEASFEAAWTRDPQITDAWVQWVQILERRGDVPGMLRAYEAFAEHHEPNSDVLVNWGRALESSGATDRALHCFTEAIQRDSSNPNAYFNAGDLLYRNGQFADAAHLYESGLRLDAQHAEGWFVLGNALAQVGLFDGARLAYEQTLRLKPEHAGAAHNIEIVLDEPKAA